jgi:hypothetical protein
MEAPELIRSTIFKQILASVREIGLIEPLVVYPQEDNRFLLLDGHLRLEALKMLGKKEVKCIISTDDESYTYNKRVNHIPPVAQHFMLVEALKSGVAEERIAATLNVNIGAIKRRVQMLDGICGEVIEMLRDRKVSLELFPVLRKMRPIGQIATVELMVLRILCEDSARHQSPGTSRKEFKSASNKGQCRCCRSPPKRRYRRSYSKLEGNRGDIRHRCPHFNGGLCLPRSSLQ